MECIQSSPKALVSLKTTSLPDTDEEMQTGFNELLLLLIKDLL